MAPLDFGASFWLPALLSAGGQGLQAAFGGVEDPKMLSSYARRPGDFLDPRLHLAQNLRDVAQLKAIGAERAAQPIDIPGAFVQPLPWRSGGGLPGPVGVTSMDPALFNPRKYLHRPGVQFGQPDYDNPEIRGWLQRGGGSGYVASDAAQDAETVPDRTTAAPEEMFKLFGGEYAPRYTPGPIDARPIAEQFGGMDQPMTPGFPQVGGGIPSLMANLELLGVTADDTGTLRMDPGAAANPGLFGGTRGVVQGDVSGAPTSPWGPPRQTPGLGPLLATYGGSETQPPAVPRVGRRKGSAGSPVTHHQDSDLAGEYGKS